MVRGGSIYKTSCLSLKKFEDVVLKGVCAVDENGIIVFELSLLTSVTPTFSHPPVISSHASPVGCRRRKQPGPAEPDSR